MSNVIDKRPDAGQLTPTFGTSCPPKGLSGALRYTAYQIPDNRTSHWMLLMLSDRIDVAESAVADLVKKPSLGLFITLGLVAATLRYLKRERDNE